MDREGEWNIPAALSDRFLVLTADYDIHDVFAKVPVVGALPRFLLEHRGLGNQLSVSLNPSHSRASWLVHGIAGLPGSIVPRAYAPLGGARLEVRKIAACVVDLPNDALPAFEHLLGGKALSGAEPAI